VVSARISDARKMAVMRPAQGENLANAQLTPEMIETIIPLEDKTMALIHDAAEKQGLSARGFHRVLRVARTIADLAGAEALGQDHLAEALQYRRLPSES